MRLLILLLLLLIGVLYLAVKNPDEHVTIWIWREEFRDVALWEVVLASVFAGFALTGILGLIEGAGFRLQNRRLRREIQRLETELNYLRTQPASTAAREPDALDTAPTGRRPGDVVAGEVERPSAPVYGSAGLAAGDEEDDDAYTGGRAV